MPICPKCIVGMPDWYTECPTCGGTPVELVHEAQAEEAQAEEAQAEEVIEPEVVAEPIEQPDDSDPVQPVVLELEEPLVEEPAIEEHLEPEPLVVEDEVPEDLLVEEPMFEIEVEDEDEDEADIEEPEDDAESETGGDEFVATDTSFTVVHSPAPVIEASAPRTKPVRWVHRAYRGSLEATSKGVSGTTILAVFGDGLLAVDGGASGLLRSFGNARINKYRKTLESSGSSEQAHEAIPGSRHFPLAEIESVYVERGRGRSLMITVRTSGDSNPQFMIGSGRHRQLAELLTPVLRSKMRDTLKTKKAAKAG